MEKNIVSTLHTDYHMLFNSIDEGICIVEKVDNGQNECVDFRCILANPAFERITRLTDVIGKTVFEIVPGTNSSTMQLFDNVIKTGQTVRYDASVKGLEPCFGSYAFPIDVPELKRVAVIFNKISDIKKSGKTLRESAVHKEYLLKLSDSLHSIDDPSLIQLTACKVLGEHIGASRVLYGDVLNERDIIFCNYINGVPSLAAHLHEADFSQFTIECYRSGKPVIINDVAADPRLSEAERNAFLTVQVGAKMILGLVKDGKWVAAFEAHHKEARNWTEQEISMMEETAERTWAAVERAKAEAAIIEINNQLVKSAEEKYRLLFNLIDQGFYIIDVIFDENDKPVDLYYVEANHASTRMLGIDFTGKRLRDIDPNYEEYWFEIFGNVAMTGQSVRMEQYAEPDKKWYNFYIFKIGDEKSRRIGNIFLDITERKRAEEALKEREKLFRTLFENTKDGFVLVQPIFDVSGHSDNYRMINVNQAWEKQTGLNADDFIGKTIRESMPGAESSWPETFANVAKSGESTHFDSFNQNSNRWYDLYAFNYEEGLVGVLFRDISERKNIEEALIESEDRLRALTVASTNVVYRMNPDWSSMTEMYGNEILTDTDKPTLRWHDKYVHPEDYEFVTKMINECIREKKLFEMEHRVLQADGSIVWTYSKAIPILDDKGTIKEWFGAASDITERKRVEALLRVQQDQLLIVEHEKTETLEEAIKMKDEFLYLITHEFKTPITVISSIIQTIDSSMKTKASDRLGRYLNMIKINTNRQLRLVDNLLDITRMSSGITKFNIGKYDIVYVTKAILKSVEFYALQKNIKLSFTSSLEKYEFLFDEEKYERIMLNLLSNALKFTPESKVISVLLSTKKLKDQSFISITVTDEGIGIPANRHQIIFERFGQAETCMSRQAEGTGLGLHLVKLLVDSLGGEISLKSKVGCGSAFTILLPVKKELDSLEENDRIGQKRDVYDIDSRIIQATRIEFSDLYLK